MVKRVCSISSKNHYYFQKLQPMQRLQGFEKSIVTKLVKLFNILVYDSKLIWKRIKLFGNLYRCHDILWLHPIRIWTKNTQLGKSIRKGLIMDWCVLLKIHLCIWMIAFSSDIWFRFNVLFKTIWNRWSEWYKLFKSKTWS